MSTSISLHGYTPGHPWFYVRGGIPLTPKQILATVKVSGYRGYLRDEIASAAARCEPRRSIELRSLRAKAFTSLCYDLSGYRRAVFSLHRYRQHSAQIECTDAHSSVSFKHNHLVGDFAHLVWIDELLSQQRDLFDC